MDRMIKRLEIGLLVFGLNLLFASLSWIRSERLFRWSYSLIAVLAEKLVRKENYVRKIRWIRGLFDRRHPSLEATRKILRGTHPHHRRTIVRTLIMNQLLVGTNKRKGFLESGGFYPPGFFVISPSMKCNLKCYGCYAGYYRKDAELSFEEIDDVLQQAKEMGIHFCVVSGGEPLFHPRIFDVFEKHDDVVFHIYTNGTLIDRGSCRRLAELGNVIPAVSVEGFRDETDQRRGAGHFDRVMRAMDLLREAGLLFGFSATLTRQNSELLSSDEFVDFMISKGCILGWYFMYVPIGREPNLDIMQTPEQRGRHLERLLRLRATKSIFLADFWNDGPVVGGCISAGRKYFHVNANGDVEPCVFCHFATHNIRTTPLKEALDSPLFNSIKCRLPSHENLLRPCVIIDKPEISRNAIFEHGAYFTHPGAEIVYEHLSSDIDRYAREYGVIADELWAKHFRGNQG
jgi:MoaA/NifB/PqqE/SkfB family radical SAM enzyme